MYDIIPLRADKDIVIKWLYVINFCLEKKRKNKVWYKIWKSLFYFVLNSLFFLLLHLLLIFGVALVKQLLKYNWNGYLLLRLTFFTTMGNQDRSSLYNMNRISSRQVMRMNKNISKGMILVDPMTEFSILTLWELYCR